MDPCLKVDQWALAKDPHCGQPPLRPSVRQQDAPDSAGERPEVQARDQGQAQWNPLLTQLCRR